MQIKISRGNMKIDCPNISFIPGHDCAPGVPCLGKCYAMKAWKQYPSVRAAWSHNSQLANTDPLGFTGEVSRYCREKRPQFFRWHVAGDIPGALYLSGMIAAAHENTQTTFLCFTKRADIVNAYLTAAASPFPSNFRLMLSAWPGLPLDNPFNLPVAWLTTDDRRPRSVFTCPGSCAACRHCWIDRKGVAFDPH